MEKVRKILIVAMPFSVHTARWVSHLDRSRWDVHIISSMQRTKMHEELSNIVFHEKYYQWPRQIKNIKYRDLTNPVLEKLGNTRVAYFLGQLIRFLSLEPSRSVFLREVIDRLKPDIIHSLESQHSGYLVDETRVTYNGQFPFWIHSNWGIDIHFFGKLDSHKKLIKSMLSHVDVFIAEGKRDLALAGSFGFKRATAVFPSVGGGFKFPNIPLLPPSKRKAFLVKGTQDMVRRGLVALRAIERCVDALEGYEILLYSSNVETRAAAELFYANTGKKIIFVDVVSQMQLLELNSKARISLCVNMSDGVPNSLFEAMAMGAFPIQSNTSMADEWVEHGTTGFLVPPEDPDVIESYIRKAICDDKLVDGAMEISTRIVRDELNYDYCRKKVNEFYNSLR